MTTIDRAADLTTTVQDAVLTMMSVLAADLMMTDRVVEAAALTTVPVAAVLRMKRSHAVAARAMSARKTHCTTARKPLVRSV
jgi:hypothetical protein